MDSANSNGTSGSLNSTSSSSGTSISPKQIVLNEAKLNYSWSSDGVIMTANFKVDNPTDHDFKDFEITCNHFAASGTRIDSNTRVVYETVKAHGKKSVRDFNMGFIDSQAKTSSCSITDLTLID